jgi:DNA-binding HxlR family transcriptional regulator
MHEYQQFCPIARAAEVVTRRWMPLVLRELMCGSVRFNDIHRGVSRMSRTLLSQRLTELERAGVVERVVCGEDAHPEYRLTQAGEELRPIVTGLGVWGRRWVTTEVTREQLDVGLLMWDVQRRVPPGRLPSKRVVLWFRFTDAPKDYRYFWLVLEPRSVDLCLRDPGFGRDLEVTTDVRTMVDIWMGDVRYESALRAQRIDVRGSRELRRQFPGWLGLSSLAGVQRAS